MCIAEIINEKVCLCITEIIREEKVCVCGGESELERQGALERESGSARVCLRVLESERERERDRERQSERREKNERERENQEEQHRGGYPVARRRDSSMAASSLGATAPPCRRTTFNCLHVYHTPPDFGPIDSNQLEKIITS